MRTQTEIEELAECIDRAFAAGVQMGGPAGILRELSCMLTVLGWVLGADNSIQDMLLERRRSLSANDAQPKDSVH